MLVYVTTKKKKTCYLSLCAALSQTLSCSLCTQDMFVVFYYRRTCLDVALCRISASGCDHRHRCGSFRGPHCANGHHRRILLHPLPEKYVSFYALAPTKVCIPMHCIIPEHTGKCPSVQMKRLIGFKWENICRYLLTIKGYSGHF